MSLPMSIERESLPRDRWSQALVLADTREMSHEDWLQYRRLGIGGSEASAVCGINPYKSALDVWLDKVGESEPVEENEPMYWGSILEENIAREFFKRTGLQVTRRNAILQHPRYPWMIADLDRVIYTPEGRGVLECKTANAWLADDWDNKVPPSYYLQVMHYLAVTGYQFGHLAVLLGGNTYRQYRIERDEDAIAALVQIESEFWRKVDEHVMPQPDGSEAAGNAIKRRFPREEAGKTILLPDVAVQHIAAYREAHANEKAAKTAKEEAGQHLKLLLGDAEVGYFGDTKVSWKSVEQTRVDSKGLKAKYPEIYREVANTSSSRRFTIAGGGIDE